MPKAQPTSPDGAHRRKVVWLTAALVVFVTMGAAFFGVRGENEFAESADAGAASTRSLVSHERAEEPARQPSAQHATEPAASDEPKSPVDNPFEFIRGLAKSAYEGDGDAQYRVAKELDRCEMTLSLVRKFTDPEATIWNLPAGWTQSMKERAFAEYHRCSRLLREDPFAELPQRPGGYGVAYWMSRATDSGQPLALVEKAVGALIVPSVESVDAAAVRAEARELLVKAVLSGNPDALLLLGTRMRYSSDGQGKLQGAAWMMAGCEAGADCSFENRIEPIWMCHDSGDVGCPPGTRVETLLSRALTPDELAQAHVLSQRIMEGVRTRDVEAITAQLGF